MRRLLLLSLCLVACREDGVDPEDLPFEPLCGEEGPVELLSLADDEEVWLAEPVGDEGDLHVTIIPTEDRTVVSRWRFVVVDRCGDEVTELPARPSILTRWGAALVGCVDGDLVQLSGYDDPSPTLLASRGCAAQPVGDAWVTIEAEPEATEGRLLALEVVGSRVEVRELLDGVTIGPPDARTRPVVLGDRVLVPTADLAVRSVDPWTSDVEIELEEAATWSAHPDAIAYRRPVPHRGEPDPDELDPDRPAPLIVRDRRTGAEQTLDAGLPASWQVEWLADTILLARSPHPLETPRWFRSDPLREVVPPYGRTIEAVRSDGLVWLSELDETTRRTTFFRWREGEALVRQFSCQLCNVMGPWSSRNLPLEVRVGNAGDHDTLWRLDDAGGTQLLASPASLFYHVMEDDRVLTVLVEGADDLGPLTLHDGSDDPVTLAPLAHRRASTLTRHNGVPGEILYETVPSADSPDDTHALFRARLSPVAR